MLAPSLTKFGPLGVKDFEVFDLPFIFKDTPSFRAVTDGPVGKALLAKLDAKGITGLAYWDNGFDVMSANRPLHHVADFKGLKMRIQRSKVLDANMRSLGDIPQVMAFSALYQAPQSGVVDGMENTVSNHGHIAYAMFSVHKDMEGRVGRDTIQAVYEAARFVAPK